MSIQTVGSDADTPGLVSPVPGEASMSVSPEDTVEALLCIRMEQLAKARNAYKTVNDIDRAIDRLVRESNMKLPYRSEYGYGMVRKGYAADRYPNPKRFRLLCRRTLVGPKKRMVVKAA